VQVALKGWKNRGAAVISSAAQPMAAVAAASFAGVADVPLLLTNGTTMPAVTQAHIRKYDVGAWAIGSQGVKAAPWATPYRGADDAGTSLLVAKKVFYPPNAVALVVAGALPDAYVAAAETAAYGYPVLVVTPGALTKAQRTYLDANSGSLNLVHLFGSTRRVSSRVLTDAVRLAAGRIDW
jgi:hypothetical protein